MRWLAIIAGCLLCYPLGVGLVAWTSTNASPSPPAEPAEESLTPLIGRPANRLSEFAFLEIAEAVRKNAPEAASSIPKTSVTNQPTPQTPESQISNPKSKIQNPKRPTVQSLTDRIDEFAVDLRNKIANSPPTLAARAETLIRDGKPRQAIALLQPALNVNPRNFDLLVAQAAACSARGDYAQAATTYSRAVAVKNDVPSIWFNFAVVLTRIRQFALAADAYNNVLVLEPDHIKAMYNLAGLYQKEGKISRALDLWKRVTESAPELAAAWFHRGTLHMDFKQYPDATNCFDRAVALEPDNADNLQNLGLALLARHRLDDAIAALEKSTFLNPDEPICLAALGRAYWLRSQTHPKNPKDRHDAIQRLQQAIKLDANLPQARTTLDEILNHQPNKP